MWTTARKVFAVGARVGELPIPDPSHVSDEPHRWVSHQLDWDGVEVPVTRRARRRMFRRLPFGAIPGYGPICLDTNDPQTVRYGLFQRLFRDTPRSDPIKVQRLRAFVAEFCKGLPVAKQMSFEEWLDRTTYPLERKAELRACFEALRGGHPTPRQCAYIATFVKSEFYQEYKHCRLINSRSDAFKAFSGPLFKAIEDVVYGLPQFVKHIPVPERPAAILRLKRAGRRYYQTDYTAFESHFTVEILEAIECQVYRHCLSWCPEAAEVLCAALTGQNRLHTRTGLRATCTARRMSGDMCTSLGNGLANWLLTAFLVAEKGGSLEGFVEGDDGLFSTDVELTAEDYHALGMTIKIVEVADPCKASFCGMVFSESGQIIRDPRKLFQGFGWTHSSIGAGELRMRELLKAKALSGVYETPHCPIAGVLFRRALDQTRGCRPRWVEDGYHVPPPIDVPVGPFAPTPDTRVLFHELYGISPEVQVQVEDAILAGDFQRVACLVPPTEHQAHYSSRYLEVG